MYFVQNKSPNDAVFLQAKRCISSHHNLTVQLWVSVAMDFYLTVEDYGTKYILLNQHFDILNSKSHQIDQNENLISETIKF